MTSFRSRLWISGEWVNGSEKHALRSPYSGDIVGEVDYASCDHVESAMIAAQTSFNIFRRTSRALRSRLLMAMARGIHERRTEFATRIVEEAGKPVTLAEIEVQRAVSTFTIAGEEAKRYAGEVIPVDSELSGRGYAPAMTLLKPRGPVLGISPFNFPLNLVAHKVAPALAVGTSIILKPPPQAPGAATLLAEVFEKAVLEISDSIESVPPGVFQILNGTNDIIGKIIADERISILSFTGSHLVGWALRDRAHKKKVLLELGGNAAVIVHRDCDLNRAAQRIAFGGYSYAGQVCISVQRVFVDRTVVEQFQSLLLKEISKLGVGDPRHRETVVGPLIDIANADRVMNWVEEAKSAGAKMLCGERLSQNIISPILLSHVNENARVACNEIFGPVMVLNSYDQFENAINRVNQSSFGLQAGVFTDSHRHIQTAIEFLDVGGILINEIPTFRADHLPYGGQRDSGLGREGIRYAMSEYSENKTVIQFAAGKVTG